MSGLTGKKVRKIPLAPWQATDPFVREGVDSWNTHGEVLGSLRPLRHSEGGRQSLLEKISTVHRFPAFEERIAVLADLTKEAISRLLLRIDTANSWGDGPVPGVQIFHFEGGPRVKDAITGFVRIEQGIVFPEHEHVGHETVVVLQGSFRDEDGTVHSIGDEIELPPGSSHHFAVQGSSPLILLTIVMGGIRVDGQLIPPGDPRG